MPVHVHNLTFLLLLPLLLTGAGAPEPEITLHTSPFKPYSFETGTTPDGIFADVVREIASRSGLRFTTKFVPWKRALVTTQDAVAPESGLIYPLIRSPEREKNFQWICRVLEEEAVFFVNGQGRPVTSPEDLKNERVGVTHGSPFEQELRTQKFANIEAVVGTDTNALKLNHGRIRAWYVPKIVGLYTFRANKIDSRPLAVIPAGRSDAIYLAASPSLPRPLAERVIKACEQVHAEGVVARIIQSYVQQSLAAQP
jgi:polar amino acid transport system substrate-binding protein